MAQVKATFFLPVQDNDGRDLLEDIEGVRGALFDLFIGWTFLGYVKGAFLMSDGTQMIDESQAYMVFWTKTICLNWNGPSPNSRPKPSRRPSTWRSFVP